MRVLSGIVWCSLNSQFVSTTLGNGPTSLGVVFEQYRDREAEAREEFTAVKLLAGAENLDLLRCGIDVAPRLARDR